MGACDFTTRARGKTAADAFSSAVASAQYEDGHGGYTGTIAEKSDFIVITPDPGESPAACVDRLMESDDRRIRDKWGPAGCVDCGPDPKNPTWCVFLFFGWASS